MDVDEMAGLDGLGWLVGWERLECGGRREGWAW